MNRFKTINAAANRYLSRFSRKQFFLAFAVITAANFGLDYYVPGYQSTYLAAVGGFFFAMMFVKFEPNK
ncbi:hypothetical protein [Pseudomonas sp. BIGb0164]|uniref:hypothetical protein n=1 Tax=Pseudomonas sp. BIGb0164 TaxID=2940605 RepID=UPI0021671BC3|nr:hypothetical protein [Pseudomonas sp. BIGb0164]MCS4250587.1 hypothetical protein [Pseudomonas sp. BIGb0164]